MHQDYGNVFNLTGRRTEYIAFKITTMGYCAPKLSRMYCFIVLRNNCLIYTLYQNESDVLSSPLAACLVCSSLYRQPARLTTSSYFVRAIAKCIEFNIRMKMIDYEKKHLKLTFVFQKDRQGQLNNKQKEDLRTILLVHVCCAVGQYRASYHLQPAPINSGVNEDQFFLGVSRGLFYNCTRLSGGMA